jgi:hypothetical protein
MLLSGIAWALIRADKSQPWRIAGFQDRAHEIFKRAV